MSRSTLRIRPLPASLALVALSVGSVFLIAIATVALVPILLGLGFFVAWVVAALLLGWAGIEALAALERWFENDPRFRR